MNRYCRNNRAISGRLHDEMVMMDPAQGKYFSLNPIATRIWDLLENPNDIDSLCELLLEEYEVDPGQCIEEVSSYIREMTGLGLLIRI